MPIVKPIDQISNNIRKLQSDIAEIKTMLEFIKDYIKTQEQTSRQGWIW
mgnify:CR=1 FL=1